MTNYSLLAGARLDTERRAQDESLIAETLTSQLVERFTAAWDRGECPPVEHFLSAEALAEIDSELAVRLIYEEMCLRREAGREMSSQEIAARFPQWRTELERLLDCERLLAPAAPASFPEVGQEIGPFRLLSELGRGAMGRVYLAVQPALSDRPVVVKLTPQTGHEHLSLARLQHTGIVPLYLAQNLPEHNVRLLCMPYLGGVTLARLLELLAQSDGPKSGRDIAAYIEAAANAEAPASHHGVALRFLNRASYAQAVCWIGACLADALHYAHQRRLAHFDVKPSNVLLAGDGQPMLLDFHLAREPLRPGERDAWLGGTPGYMAPEQQSAMAALREGRPIPAAVDHRSDIYSLGVLLDELLQRGRRPVEPHLKAIVRKCLAASPERRYQDAAALAVELRRSMAEPSRTATAWRATPMAAALAVVVVGLLISVAIVAARLRHSQSALTAAQARWTARMENEHAERLAASLRGVMDRLRWLEARRPLDSEAKQSLDAACRTVWERRGQFLQAASNVDSPTQTAVREDLMDLTLLWASVCSRPQAVELLDAAEREFGPHPLLTYARIRANGQSDADPPKSTSPALHTAWEHYALSRFFLHEGRLDEAHQTLRRGAASFPRNFWLQYHLGVCAEQRKHHEEALAAFSACIALAPERWECRRRRASVYRALGRVELAVLDETTARRELD